jgi:hypothetical protein
MFGNARRDGVPISRAAIAVNFADHKLPQSVSGAQADPPLRRVILDTDLLHVSVQLEPGPADRPHNNPAVPLARIDDAGRIQETA